MKNNLKKFIARLIVFTFIISMLEPLANDGTWLERVAELFAPVEEVEAASDPVYYFNFNSDVVNDGAQLDYTDYKTGLNTIKIILKCDQGIPSGTAISWTVSNENIVKLDPSSEGQVEVTLDILAPGYSGLSVSLERDGVKYPSVAYCVIHVPLEWSDDDADNPNIKAEANPDKYGLMMAQNTDATVKTLQMFTQNSSDHADKYHYLRKVRYVKYGYATPGAAASYGKPYVPSDIAEEDLTTSVAPITWSSSDPNVVEVDSITGLVTAKSAGFATVTVSSNTRNEVTKAYDSISYNVLVVPEGYINGYSTDYMEKSTYVVDPHDDELVIQSNAKFADSLSWKLFKGDAAASSKDITAKFQKNMEVNSATGRVVLSDLPAGVYHLTAIPVKDPAQAMITPTYDVTNALIEYMAMTIVVPIRFPKDQLILNYYNSNVYDTYDLLGESNFPAGSFRFSSSPLDVATVGANDGVVKAVGLGNANVYIVANNNKVINDLFGTYAASAGALTFLPPNTGYKVNVEVVNGVSISSTSEVMPLGSSLQLYLTAPNPYEGDIIWKSSDEKVVTVDENGLVTAVGVSKDDVYVTVKVKVKGVTKQAKCKIKVVAAVDDIKLNSKNDFVEVGDNLTISATISPKLAGAKLVWSVSDESLATIATTSDLSMTITGVKAGTVVVRAVNPENSIVATKIIKVVQEVQKLTLSDTELTLPQTVGFYQLYAYCEPELPPSQSLKWTSSNKRVATVDANGKVTLLKPGQTVITVSTPNGLLEQCNLTITQGVTGITFDTTEMTLYVGDKERITYVVKPDTATNVQLNWQSFDTKIATVDASGYVTAKNVGTTIIRAKSADGTGVEAMCKVTVLQSATAMKLDVTELTMNVGENHQLEVILTPVTSSDVVTFESSNTKIATVTKRGKISAKAKGNCVIMARTSAGLIAYVNVTVTQQVTGVKLSANEATIYAGEELKLTATITPANANDKELTWTSTKPKVASVENGVVKGLENGTTLIQVVTSDGEYMDFCMVTVIELVTEIILPEEAEVGVGRKLKLEATVSGEKATNKNVTWKSSNKKIATVNSKGKVTGKKVGTCIITVTATDGSGAYAECELRVFRATNSLEVDPSMSYVELTVGEQKTIKTEADPVNLSYAPIWTSSDPSIAIVNKKGTITGLKAGTTTVIVTAGDDPSITGTVVVKVSNPKDPIVATNITFDENELIMLPGETHMSIPVFTPGNITEQYTWSSDNPSVASVDPATGKITANKVGTANITLITKLSGKKGTIKVFVVGLSDTDVELYQYQELLLDLKIDGQPADMPAVRWGTNNQNIAEISNGHVTAKAVGKTEVYAMIKGRKLVCKVKVVKNIKK